MLLESIELTLLDAPSSTTSHYLEFGIMSYSDAAALLARFELPHHLDHLNQCHPGHSLDLTCPPPRIRLALGDLTTPSRLAGFRSFMDCLIHPIVDSCDYVHAFYGSTWEYPQSPGTHILPRIDTHTDHPFVLLDSPYVVLLATLGW